MIYLWLLMPLLLSLFIAYYFWNRSDWAQTNLIESDITESDNVELPDSLLELWYAPKRNRLLVYDPTDLKGYSEGNVFINNILLQDLLDSEYVYIGDL